MSIYPETESVKTPPDTAAKPESRSPQSTRPAPSGRRGGWARFGRENAYLASSFPVALVSFVIVVTVFGLVVGLIPLFLLGFLVLWGLVYYGRGASRVERDLVAWTRSRDVPRPVPPREARGFPGRLKADLSHGQSWMNLAWILVDFVLSTVTFWIAFFWWTMALVTVAGPLMVWMLHTGMIRNVGGKTLSDLLSASDRDILWVSDHPNATEALLYLIFGAIFLVTLPWLAHGLTLLRSTVSQSMLCRPISSKRRIESLEGSRAASRRADIDSMRRLERDIHDGPQQRLVRLDMDLARAERVAVNDPQKASEILRGARSQSRDTLLELRQLSRGIAPAILVDRGLRAAVTDVASRSQLSVRIAWNAPPDLPPHVESTAYFVISECLVNANKHAAASVVDVTVKEDGQELVVEVCDDGAGGASAAKGHGLAGLSDRVTGVEGRFVIESPRGGPTRVRSEIPCEPS
ncbi:sensor histidine kinase [Curtobacterium sp. S6]|uniref:sensor histidine kinase n=2 Tax=Micrococcales TaxID=85006 RepID=UPI00068BF05A|nr:sensor domain-containing protein [Curtobacterium sp. S6]